MNKILLNLSRIGKNGTGLYIYSKNVVEILNEYFVDEVDILMIKNLNIKTSSNVIFVPDKIAMESKVSKIKPVLWYFYSKIHSYKNYMYSISTTHHVLANIKNQIITIHDLRPYYFPDSLNQKIYFQYILPRTLKQIDGIITVSNATKKDIVKVYKIDPSKIHIVPNCIDLNKFLPGNKKQKPYILLVGATWFHKNAHELLMYSDIWKNQYELKIIAGESAYKKYLKKIIKTMQLENKVEFLTNVSDLDLLTLYQEASVLVYPSILEGFGIPPLEAIACGTPVIVSDIEVFKECYGEFPIYVELKNRKSWEKAFKSLLNKEDLQNKVAIGQKKVAEYTFTRMKKSLMHAIYSVWPEFRK